MIKTTKNNNFYTPARFNSYKRKADKKNKYVLTTENTAIELTILQQLGSEASVVSNLLQASSCLLHNNTTHHQEKSTRNVK